MEQQVTLYLNKIDLKICKRLAAVPKVELMDIDTWIITSRTRNHENVEILTYRCTELGHQYIYVLQTINQMFYYKNTSINKFQIMLERNRGNNTLIDLLFVFYPICWKTLCYYNFSVAKIF